MTILAVAMIAVLFLITPVVGYVPPGGGGSSGGSSSGSGSTSGTSEQTYASTVSSGTFTSVGGGWSNSDIKNNPPVSRISIETKNFLIKDTQVLTYTVGVMSDNKLNEFKKKLKESHTLVVTQLSEETPMSHESLDRLASDCGFHAPQTRIGTENAVHTAIPANEGNVRDNGIWTKLKTTDNLEQLTETKEDLNVVDGLRSNAKTRLKSVETELSSIAAIMEAQDANYEKALTAAGR
jgi:hypothetical protein